MLLSYNSGSVVNLTAVVMSAAVESQLRYNSGSGELAPACTSACKNDAELEAESVHMSNPGACPLSL